MIIYKATFPNGKVYIGKTKRKLNERIYHHINNSKKDKYKHIVMAKAIRKYGEENINWEVIKECSSLEEMSESERFFIKKYNSTDHINGYNMVCGDKKDYETRNNFDKYYLIEIVKKKLKSNGYNSDNYIPFTEELESEIIRKYIEELYSIKKLVREYKISKNRITRLLKSKNIEIDLYRCKLTNSISLSGEQISFITSKHNDGKSIKIIAEEEKLTIQTVSRVLHDLGIRISKRFKNGKRYDGKQPKGNKTNI